MNGVGAKKFSKSLEAHGDRTFWRDMPGCGGGLPFEGVGAKKLGA